MTPPETLPHPRPHPGFAAGGDLWLLRHAEVHVHWRGKAYGSLDVPLAPEGEARTAEMGRDWGRGLALGAIACSPLERAARLGRAVAEAGGLEAVEDDDLREIDRGSWQGRVVEEIQAAAPEEIDAFYADPWAWSGHGGECDADLAARGWAAAERVLRRGDGRAVLVATHYNVIRVLAASALGIPPVRSFALRLDTGRGMLLRDAPGGWELVHANVHAPPGVFDDA